MSTFRMTLLALSGLLLLSSRPASAADTYTVDETHAFVVFKVKHLGIAHCWGMFRKVGGTFVVDEKKPSNSSVKLEIDAASVFTANKKRDTHVRNADFLNTKQYPKITFESTKVKKKGEGAVVFGKLTLHGVTRTVSTHMAMTGKGKDPWGNHRAGFEGTFKVKRSDFGMNKMKGAVGDTIELMVSVEGILNK